ncbi:MAG: F0F1 ATP synthase subunit gamma [Chloroflexota bacterium]|nr:F0F1 ATP synthase subunit gamma [Chloroflexota bacterium]
MTPNFERAKSRLNNIQAIEPLLAALRTLSMGTWQTAANKIIDLNQYETKFDPILSEILPKIKFRKASRSSQQKKKRQIADTIILIIGTERGLCGKFNRTLSNNALLWINSQKFSSYQVWAMGSRLIQHLEYLGVNLSWRKSLHSPNITSYTHSYQLTTKWLKQYESYAFNHFILIFNQITQGNKNQFSTHQLIPYTNQSMADSSTRNKSIWPPPIIETDPKGIYNQIINQKIASSFYQTLLKSTIAENSYRYNLLQEAEDNAEEIIEELKSVINTERKRKITQEMQELASGAGLLDN